jgi:hypothetical protein
MAFTMTYAILEEGLKLAYSSIGIKHACKITLAFLVFKGKIHSVVSTFHEIHYMNNNFWLRKPKIDFYNVLSFKSINGRFEAPSDNAGLRPLRVSEWYFLNSYFKVLIKLKFRCIRQ